MNTNFDKKYMTFDWVFINGQPNQIIVPDIKDASPIILKPEFLEMNGFILHDSSMGYKNFHDVENDVYIQFNGKCCYILFNNKIKYLRYVHQLQHYYNFLEIEKIWIFK